MMMPTSGAFMVIICHDCRELACSFSRGRVDYTVYSDFTCAECYGLNEQLVALGVSGAVLWRGVQIEPLLPVRARPLDRRVRGRIEDEITEVRRRVDGVVMPLPRAKPNTLKAI